LELLRISRLPPEERPPEPLPMPLGPHPTIADIIRNRRMRHLAAEAEARTRAELALRPAGDASAPSDQ
jgi:hypothetical protein